MKHFLLPFSLLAVFLAAGASQVHAQVPRTMSYQGIVIDGAGKFISDGAHNIALNLYDNIGSSTPIYTENHIGVVFVKGLFNVIIGSITPIPATVIFDRGYFLGVSVDGGAEMNPRTPLSAAPYALHAAIADQASSLAPGATGFVSSVNASEGAITLQGGGATTVTNVAGTITISSTAGGLILPYSQSMSGDNPLFGITNTGTSNAGFFNILNAANTNAALLGSSNGTGPGLLGTNSAVTGTTTGVRGEASSTSNGIGASGGVTGVLGVVTPATPGGYSAALRGVNNGTGGTGIGAVGYQAGSGWGVYGETPKGFGVYGLTTDATAVSTGVRGETFSANGVGVAAKYSGSGIGTPFELSNGAIKVSGTNKAAFVHTATVANKISANGSDIDNALCNGDPNAFVFVTQRLNPTSIVYNNSPIGVYYNSRGRWEIFNETIGSPIPVNAQFFVLVIKQ